MKKPLIVVTLLLLVLCIGASAAETCFTLPDIREQAKQGWHQTYTAHGREVVVDIEIVVNDASRFLVLKAKASILPRVCRFSGLARINDWYKTASCFPIQRAASSTAPLMMTAWRGLPGKTRRQRVCSSNQSWCMPPI